MAAPVVATTQTASSTSSASVTITKPTGLAVGDRLFAGILVAVATDAIIATPSGWTAHGSSGSDATRQISIFSKTADSADVAASNFSFTTTSGSATGIVGILARVTGLGAVGDFEVDSRGAGSTTVSFTGASTPDFAESLLLMFFGACAGTAVPTISTYTSTPSNTWSEVVELGINAGTEDPVISLATAEASSLTQITAYGATISTSADRAFGGLIVLTPVINAAIDVSHIAITPTIEGVTASSVNVATDVGHNAITPTINGIETEVSSDRTQWTNESKNTSTWTNEPKS